MARIHLIGGEKGGVGKTFVCRCLAQYFLIQGWEFCLIDADTGINDVSSVFESIPMTLSDDPHRYAEPDVLFNKALEKTVIVNLPSNTKEALNRWLRETSFLSFAQHYQVSLLYWFVTDGCYSSIKLLEKSLSEFDRQIPHLLIRNQGRLNGPDFSYLDRDDFYRQIVTASNLVQVVDFPKLGSEEQFFIDKYSLNLREAQLKAQEQNRIMSAQRIKSFVDQLLTVFEQVDFAGAIEAAAPSPAIKVRHTAKPSDLIENHKEAETV